MAATDDRKRRYPIEPSDSDQIPRQPPKKRFLSSTPTSPTNSHAADMADEQQAAEDPNDPFKNQILNYQKDAIFRQTTDYKRMARRLKRKASVMEADIAEAEGRYQAQAQPWSKVNQELQDLSSTVLESSSVLDQTQVFEKLFSHSYLWSNAGDDGASPEHSDMLRKEAGPIHGIIRRMGHHLDKQIASRTNLFEKYKDMLDHNASGKYASSLSRWKDHQQLAVDKQRAYRVIVSELISVKGQYEAAVHKSRKLQKYIMEMKNETVQASLNSASDVKVGQSADMVVDKPDELNGQHDTSQSGTSQPEAIQPDVGTDIPISDDISQGPAEADPLTSVRLRAASILQEIDATKESNSSLKQQVDELQFALVCIGDNIVSEVPISKQLEHSVRQRQSRCRDLSEKCENLEKTLANCLQERCKLLDTNQNDSSEEMKAITEQMKSLEQVLSSTRSERDNLQTTLDEKRAKMEIERASVSEMKVLADARQARLNSVKKDKMRLILKCAASSGDRDMFELLRATQDIEGSMSSWLDSKLQSLEEEFEQLQKVLANAHQNSIVAPERRRLAMSQHYWQKKHERFQAELDTISRDYGDGNTPLNMRDPESVIQSLQKASEGKEKRIKELEQKLKDLETLESELLVEVAGLAAGFSELEEQNSQKVDELIKKEDEIVSLQSQKLKHNQTFTALNKSKDVFKLLSNQLQRQNDMQLEVIRQYNEHEKNINAQINNYDREMISVSSAFDLHQQQIADVQANHGDIEERLTGLTSRLSDLRQLIKDRSKLLEDIYYQRCRIEEESELLKRRLDAMARVENPTEMKLAKEREEYKTLLKCSSCHLRFKSHVLLRCMHTFCKECLDTRIETRQRKCPNCGESFGSNDSANHLFFFCVCYMLQSISNAWANRKADKKQSKGHQVIVNVYDMIEPCTLTNVGYILGVGIFHSGVEVNGSEYCYGGHPYEFSGVFVVDPKVGPPGVLFKQSINMGYSDMDEEQITALIQTLSNEFAGNSYNLLNRNCNHFTAELSRRLTGKSIPGWINRAAKLGTMFPCVLPAEWIDPPECEFTDGEDQSNSLSPALSLSSNTPLKSSASRTTHQTMTSFSSVASNSGQRVTSSIRKGSSAEGDSSRPRHAKTASSSQYSDRKQSINGLESSARGHRASSIASNSLSLPRRSSTPASIRLSHSLNDTDSDRFVIQPVSLFAEDDDSPTDSTTLPIREPNSVRPEVVRSATQLSLKASIQELEKS